MSNAADVECSKSSDTETDVTAGQSALAEGTEPAENPVLPQLSEVALPEKKDAAAQLMELVEGMAFFHDETRRPFVQINTGGRKEIMALKSDDFKYWLRYQYYLKYQDIVASEAVKKTVDTLVGKAVFAGARHQLQVRVAAHEGAIWYDLANENCQSVRIAPGTWTVENDQPILFQRFRKSGAQVIPERDGDIKDLLGFVNITDEAQQCLLLSYLVNCFIPGVPKPPAHINGEKGSGKTTVSRLIKTMVDPSNIDTISLPSNRNELMLQLAQTYMPVYDNQVALMQWQSNLMCCAATGGGMSKRELNTDAGEIIFRFTRPVIMNGINGVAQESDLLDRCIIFEQERISDKARITEEEFWKRFREQQPKILGGIFNTLSRAMQIYPSVHLTTLPRMADFGKWGCAIAEAMGYDPKVFLDAYAQNVRRTNQAAIENHPLALTLILLMKTQPVGFETTAGNLLKRLEKVAENEGVRTSDKQFPKTAAVLVRRLKEVKCNLQAEGFDYEVARDTRNNSTVRVFPIQSQENR